MTEREQPTNADIQAAINNLAAAYHEFVQALNAREEEYRRERQFDRQQRKAIRERLDQLFGQLDAFQRKVDRQFDVRDREFDAFKAETERRLAALENNDASNAANPGEP